MAVRRVESGRVRLVPQRVVRGGQVQVLGERRAPASGVIDDLKPLGESGAAEVLGVLEPVFLDDACGAGVFDVDAGVEGEDAGPDFQNEVFMLFGRYVPTAVEATNKW